MSVKASARFRRIHKAIIDEHNLSNEVVNKLFEQYCEQKEVDGKKQWFPKEEHKEAWEKESKDFLATKAELNWEKLPTEWIENVKLSAKDLDVLDAILE